MKKFVITLIALILATALSFSLAMITGNFTADKISFSGKFTGAACMFLISIFFLFEIKNAEKPMDRVSIGTHNPIKRRYSHQGKLKEYKQLVTGIFRVLTSLGILFLVLGLFLDLK